LAGSGDESGVLVPAFVGRVDEAGLLDGGCCRDLVVVEVGPSPAASGVGHRADGDQARGVIVVGVGMYQGLGVAA
jgi:hypothetical protein